MSSVAEVTSVPAFQHSGIVPCHGPHTDCYVSDIPRRRPGAQWTITITQPSHTGHSTELSQAQ